MQFDSRFWWKNEISLKLPRVSFFFFEKMSACSRFGTARASTRLCAIWFGCGVLSARVLCVILLKRRKRAKECNDRLPFLLLVVLPFKSEESADQ